MYWQHLQFTNLPDTIDTMEGTSIEVATPNWSNFHKWKATKQITFKKSYTEMSKEVQVKKQHPHTLVVVKL